MTFLPPDKWALSLGTESNILLTEAVNSNPSKTRSQIDGKIAYGKILYSAFSKTSNKNLKIRAIR